MSLWSLTKRSPWPQGLCVVLMVLCCPLHAFQPGSFSQVSDVTLQIGAAQGVSLLPSSGRVSPEPFLPFCFKRQREAAQTSSCGFWMLSKSESFGYQRINAEKQIPCKCVLDGD